MRQTSDSKNELPLVNPSPAPQARESRNTRTSEIRLVLMGIAALVSYLGLLHGVTLTDLLAVGASLIGGFPVFVETSRALRHRSINMEVSMTVAIIASLLSSQFTAAVVVTFFVLLSEYIESYAVDKGRATIAKLEESIPRRAMVRRDGHDEEIDVDKIRSGEVVIARVGERIPVDGIVTKGLGSVNQAAITGEGLPVDKKPGSKVFAGSINETDVLEIQTEKVGTETVFGQIIKLVEEAEARKAPIQKLSDKLATWLVEFTILFAIITFVITRNLISTISVIVVAGACGVAAGTPLAIVATMGSLAKKGVIVKGGVYIQEMSKVDTIVVDKTGTLTQGRPQVTDIIGFDGCSQEQVLAYAATAERLSSHPLARAITERAQELGVASLGNASVEVLAGKGIVARYDGETFVAGNSSLMKDQNVMMPENAQAAISAEISKGHTTVIIAHGSRACGVIGISDAVREESKNAVRDLGDMGISTIMLTGDNKMVAERIASQTGIELVYPELLPPDKVTIIEHLSETGEKIAMVGDGINDAPALARANVGIGMGAGTDIAIEEADIVLMTNDLERIPAVIKAAKGAYRVILENFYGTLIVDGIGLALAFNGLLNPLFAASIHVVSELVFILNSARLIR